VSSAPSLYRRHRPRSFADVVGQEPVVRTLRHAVERGSVHHAYLFVGSRGTGKTSMAKILAACLNCERGPTVSPCGVCDSCRSIAAATSLDVIEMDAASNNSVDDIRDLRESVAYAPVSGRHKVYILDEAHMLSSAAWNAFLKTLEEPPPHTVFVLATTEAQKVPATVVDRCHRFDFQRPTVEQISSVVRRAAEAESIVLPPEAAAAIARSATGSFRDALGTLEQLVTYSGQEIALADVLAVLGVVDAELLAETFGAVAAGDARCAMLAVQRCVEGGRDAGSFMGDLETRARELLVVQTLGAVPAELSVTPELDAALAEQAGGIPAAAIVRLLDLLAEAYEAVKAGSEPRTQLELALVKAATPQVDASTRALLSRIERLEAALSRQPDQGTATAPAAPRAAAAAAPAAAAPAGPDTPPPATGREAAPTGPETPAPADGTPPAVISPPSPPRAPEPVASGAGRGPAPGGSSSVAAVAPVEQAITPAPDPASAPPPGAADAVAVPDRAAPAGESSDVDELRSLWPAVLDLVRGENALLAAVIADARPVAVAGEELTVAFAPGADFLKKKAEDHANRTAVAEALRQITGRRLRPSYELRALPADDGGTTVVLTPDEVFERFVAEFDAEELPNDEPGEAS
jgi:DNA polymerase-3 subunit gamma/tau